MKNRTQEGDVLNVTVPTGATYTSGIPVVRGSIVGVPVTTQAEATLCALMLTGVFDLAKSIDTEAGHISVGDDLYWDEANLILTKNPEAGAYFGVAVADALAAATTVEALLIQGGKAGGTSAQIVELVAPTGGVTAGDFVKVGRLFGKVLNTAAQTESMFVDVGGVHAVPKTTDVTNGVIATEGLPIYWDAGAGEATIDDDTGSNDLIGYSVKTAIAADTEASILLDR